MATITIRESQPTQDGFEATVSIDHQTQYPITVRNPFDERQERALEFYFEEWIRFPFDQQVKARQAGKSVKDYGERMFDDVFANRRAYADYQRVCGRGLAEVTIEIEGNSPEFQALHWEALRDPDQPRPLAVECNFVRKRFQQSGLHVELTPSPVINLLVVTARPDEADDVGYRTISRPLIEAIEKGRLRVNVELLRPGTFAALSEHLERKAGFYHIVHFDAHGGLMTYEQFKAGVKHNRYVFQTRIGRDDLESYEGQKAFLFLEGGRKGQADPVEAQELADLLVNKGIPICILNACQSGKQVGLRLRSAHGQDGKTQGEAEPDEIEVRETSLGSRLMGAGVQMVVAMGYSVTVSAAALMMEKLYGELFAQRGIPEAIRLGRKALHQNKNRKAYFNKVVELEDWLLPVVYANGEVDLRLEELRGRERAEFLSQRARQYRFEEPTYGFVGRDLEILQIEKALLRHNILLLRGMGGTGKTTLLQYLRAWWQTTQFAKEVFYFGYDEGAHTLQYMLREMGKRLCADKYAFAEFEAMPLEAQTVDVADRLRAEPYGLVLDNLESVTGQALAIENTLPEADRKQIRDFLMRLRGGQTKVVLGSRSGEEWLADAFSDGGRANLYELRGLDPESRTVLAEKILAAQVRGKKRIAEIRKDENFGRLMKLLAGYPLAMEVVLANLERQSPKEILAGLDAADVESFATVGALRDDKNRTVNILKCVDYAYSNLSKDAQEMLLCLAPFSGVINKKELSRYFKRVQKSKIIECYDEEYLQKVLNQVTNSGLCQNLFSNAEDASVQHQESFLTIQPTLPYFLRKHFKQTASIKYKKINYLFKSHYQDLAVAYFSYLDSKKKEKRSYGLKVTKLEYENLINALEICFHHFESPFMIAGCLNQYFDLTNDFRAKINLAELIFSKLESYPKRSQDSSYFQMLLATIDTIALGYFHLTDYQKSLAHYNKELSLLRSEPSLLGESRGGALALVMHQIGNVLYALHNYKNAKARYQDSLSLNQKCSDVDGQIMNYHQLGMVAKSTGNYEEAISYFEKTLELIPSNYSALDKAGTYAELGNTYRRIKNFYTSVFFLKKALVTYHIFEDFYEQGKTSYNLGIVMEELKDQPQAKLYFQDALSIFIEKGYKKDQASVYLKLGSLARSEGEFNQALLHYRKSLNSYLDFRDLEGQSDAYNEIGLLFQEENKYIESKEMFLKAFHINTELNNLNRLAVSHHYFGNLSFLQKNFKSAKDSYQKSLDMCIESNQHYNQAVNLAYLGMLAKAEGDDKQFRSKVQQAGKIIIKFIGEQDGQINLSNFSNIRDIAQESSIAEYVSRLLNISVDGENGYSKMKISPHEHFS